MPLSNVVKPAPQTLGKNYSDNQNHKETGNIPGDSSSGGAGKDVITNPRKD